MAKRKNDKKTGVTRHGNDRIPARNPLGNRNRLVALVVGVIVVAVVAWLVLGSNSKTRLSQRTPAIADQPVKVVADNGQTPASTGHGPAIYFPEPSYDFGAISQGDKVSHTFVVQNTGDEPLKLIRAQGT